MPVGKNSGDQPSLKETATDCGLFVVLNRLLSARLGHHPTLPGVDPARADSGKHWVLLR